MAQPKQTMKDVSCGVLVEALGTAKDRYVASPARGTIKAIFIAVDTAVDGDNVITCSIGATAITGGSDTLTTAHVAGTVRTIIPTAANTVQLGQVIKVATDGGGTAGQVRVTFLIEQD
jgi:hypothetical protein